LALRTYLLLRVLLYGIGCACSSDHADHYPIMVVGMLLHYSSHADRHLIESWGPDRC